MSSEHYKISSISRGFQSGMTFGGGPLLPTVARWWLPLSSVARYRRGLCLTPITCPQVLHRASGVLYFVSTCVNPILYHIMSAKFRQAVRVGQILITWSDTLHVVCVTCDLARQCDVYVRAFYIQSFYLTNLVH